MKELLNIPLSYGELTRNIIGEEPKKGGSKGRQLKQIENLCRVEQQGRKYIIKEIYQEPKEIKNNCKGKKNMYVPYTEPLLLSMLNQEGATIFHGILTDSVIFNYFYGFKEITNSDIKHLREDKYKKRISTKFIKQCYNELDIYDFKYDTVVRNTINQLNKKYEGWNIERIVKLFIGNNTELGDAVDRQELCEIEDKISQKKYKTAYRVLPPDKKMIINKEAIIVFNEKRGTKYSGYQKVNDCYKTVEPEEYMNLIEKRENKKIREEYTNNLKLEFRKFAYNRLSKLKVERKKDEEKIKKLGKPKYGNRKLIERDYEIVVKIDLLNLIISKTFNEPQYPSREPFISTYEYMVSKIELLEIIVEEQAEEINKLKEENRKKQEEQAKKIKQLEEEIKRLKNNNKKEEE